VVVGLSAALVPWLTGWLTSWALVGAIVIGGLLVALGVRMGIHSKAARLFLTIAVTLVGAVTGIHEIVAPSGHSSAQSAHEKPHR